MEFLVSSETSKLRSVIIGIADSLGKTPVLQDLYDPKSIENLKKGTYPLESDMVNELQNFVNVLKKYGVNVYRPKVIEEYNQIFTRDIGFVIDNFFFKSNDIISEIRLLISYRGLKPNLFFAREELPLRENSSLGLKYLELT